MADGRLLLLMVVLPFLGALAAPFMSSFGRNGAAWLAGIVSACCTTIAVLTYPDVAATGSVRFQATWVPSLGLDVTLRMDGFAWLFAALVSGMSFLVVLYARYYMSPADPVPRFFAFFLGFMGSMLGMVLSGNLILLVVFWELTSIFSFLLIGYWYHNASARDGAAMALTVTGTGGLALLAGVLVIGHIVGSYELDEVLGSGDLIREHAFYPVALVLVLLGTLTKSAQFPFHFWLPNAMAAPTPVSAFLHSATMVKAGVFLMARLWPVLAGTQEWFWLVGLAGLASLLLGAYFAIFQHDLKGLLAYSTISHLGLITVLLSLGSPLGAVAAIFHMVNHATFKASLFMAAGIIDHETGTRDMHRLSGLFRFMPITATLAMVASAAMAGVPLLNGFLSKEMFFAEAIETHVPSILDTVTPYVAVVASLFSVTYSVRFIQTVFFGPAPRNLPREPHEPPFWMRVPVGLLVLACVLVGVTPGLTIGPFLHLAVVSVLGEDTPEFSLAVWHGLNLPLVMSVVALVGGVVLYWLLKSYLATCPEGPPVFRRLKGQRIFEQLVALLAARLPRAINNVSSSRNLQPQLRVMLSVVLLAAVLALLGGGIDLTLSWPAGFDPIFASVWAIAIVCALAVAYQAKFHRLAALILLGGAGICVCVTFVWLSAPDLALTQLLVEIVTTVLILLGLRWLPKRMEPAEPQRLPTVTRLKRIRDLVLAILAGLGMTLLAHAVMTRPADRSLANYFLERAYTEGGGRNVVNVILVDFRSFDTLGEVTVLAIVALSVFALLRRFRPAPDSILPPEQQRIQREQERRSPGATKGTILSNYLFVPTAIMQWLFSFLMMLAAYLFLRGHDLPGGGFAAGITMTAAFILQYMAAGTRWLEDRLHVQPLVWMGLGLLLATATGLASWLFEHPFLTSHTRYLDVPLIGKVPAASALVFDLGVFALVLGATVLMLIAIAHQSIRNLRIKRLPAHGAKEES